MEFRLNKRVKTVLTLSFAVQASGTFVCTYIYIVHYPKPKAA